MWCKKELKKKKKINSLLAEEYSSTNKEICKKIKLLEEKWVSDKCAIIKGSLKVGNSKKICKTFNPVTNTRQTKTTVMENNEEADVLQGWAEYCKDLYNFQINFN